MTTVFSQTFNNEEAVSRASQEAEACDEQIVKPEHIENIMAQLMLDF